MTIAEQIKSALLAGERQCAIAARLGIKSQRVSYHAVRLLGSKQLSRKPSRQKWVTAATEAAKDAWIPVGWVLSGKKLRPAVLARWTAWKALADEGRYSISGIGQVSGHDHTSVLHGIRRLKENIPIAP